MNRLDKERQARLEPKRIEFAAKQIRSLGHTITMQDEREIRFLFRGNEIKFFPYSGWHTGKGIRDGRGWLKLFRQIRRAA